ncbi:MAG: alanine racemase [Actinomycetota bacterium]|jgi:alanine racemase
MTSRVHSGRIRRELRFSRSVVSQNLESIGLDLSQIKPLLEALTEADGLLDLQGRELLLLEQALGIRSGRSAVQLVGELVLVKDVPAGTPISYGYLARTRNQTNLGLVALGFSDGLPRNLSNQIQLEISGRHYPALGRIAMDQCVVDLGTDKPSIGSEVQFFNEVNPLAKLSELSGFTELEILGRIAARVTRTWF